MNTWKQANFSEDAIMNLPQNWLKAVEENGTKVTK